jgi:hypothetical protein
MIGHSLAFGPSLVPQVLLPLLLSAATAAAALVSGACGAVLLVNIAIVQPGQRRASGLAAVGFAPAASSALAVHGASLVVMARDGGGEVSHGTHPTRQEENKVKQQSNVDGRRTWLCVRA